MNVQLSVQPVYPINGTNWMSYVKNDGTDIFSGSGTACAGTETGYAGCLHGGQMREVVLSGISSCSGLSMTDALGVFVWNCQVRNGAATFFSTDFQQGAGLQSLVNSSSWNANSVTLSGSNGIYVYSGTSQNSVWGWTNPISVAPSNPLPGDAQVNLATSGIYVVTSSQATSGYNIKANQVALVTLPGVILSYAGENTSWCGGYNSLVCFPNARKFDWLEGIFEALPSAGTTSNNSIYTSATPNFSRFHLMTVKDSTNNAMDVTTTNSIFDQMRFFNNNGTLTIDGGSAFVQLVAGNNVALGLVMDTGTGNTFSSFTISNTGNFGFYFNGPSLNTVNNFILTNNNGVGLGMLNDNNNNL